MIALENRACTVVCVVCVFDWIGDWIGDILIGRNALPKLPNLVTRQHGSAACRSDAWTQATPGRESNRSMATQETWPSREFRFCSGGEHSRSTAQPTSVGPTSVIERYWKTINERKHPHRLHNPAGGLGNTWDRPSAYQYGEAAIGIEKYSDGRTAYQMRRRPQHSGETHAQTPMDRRQTREVKGHAEGRWAVWKRQVNKDGWVAKIPTDEVQVRPPVPAPAAKRENLMYRNLVAAEQWQTTDLARGRLPGHGHPRPVSATSRESGLSPFWRSGAGHISIGDRVRRSRSQSARASLAMEESTIVTLQKKDVEHFRAAREVVRARLRGDGIRRLKVPKPPERLLFLNDEGAERVEVEHFEARPMVSRGGGGRSRPVTAPESPVLGKPKSPRKANRKTSRSPTRRSETDSPSPSNRWATGGPIDF